ncbi:1,4-dihydroxy-2-naphthoate polyprenyltransferase [Gallibacterium anatis]|uniref:1,4-dihydroxy-2-naphthoate octaprenyltransferase n=2 Tax=Gallibacterium anatis TaxID=750 RepID=A0A921L1S5_9PAST|nr:1,4-dihydroxy-2-naphthoate polyprenyltransferase [Gallibacterium anatis]KGQ24921.1 1,4-dihydroxy-2-naphthoate prenyltransferase [Gallibacterium anatis CCM5995]KGQ59641.1 1,4-dihydroxy-2-naphthoate prenyltransferase [Gallibacterium anatis 4895]MDK9429723.1 1,4-dihydroxy-2-naphthoate polyprenyltransferase [Gallibacterium anatis]MDK9561509.1 1,4-dihydroxy-2-naphthoate polyprenyltransferase [Gallibacterium anatis]UZD15923.1 1,4-dihydroxy-2-naphthoate polyprenyltransferase [Gallibacterium anatis
MESNKCKMWFETARPKTLPLAIASIVTGSALAYYYHQFNGTIALLALITATLLQIVSNFANDYGDHIKGSDTAERIGPLRGIQQGAITFSQLRVGLILVTLASMISGAALIAVACQTWNDVLAFIVLGILAIIASITYTVGKKPYGYMGLGDVSVFIFFGLLGVCGTFYLQSHLLNWAMVLPAMMSGLLAVAVLNINNLRDIEQDKKSGKNTLIVRIGAVAGRYYHISLLILATLFALLFALYHFQHWYSFIFILVLPLLAKHAVFVMNHRDALQLRPMLAQMAKLALLFNIIFSLGLCLG